MKAPVLPIILVVAAAGLVAAGVGCSSFAHVAPGQSVLVSQAKKPVVIATPAPAVQEHSIGDHQAFTLGSQVVPDLPRSEPLPPSSMADYFALGNSLLQQGQNAAAADAFKKATELDPTYAEAWHNLALSYESAGDEVDALEAFRRYKSLPTGQ